MEITSQDFINMVAAMVKGVSFVTFESVTTPKLRKGNPWGGSVTKVSHVNATIGYSYENAVNRQRVREDAPADFEAAPRAWGQLKVINGKPSPYFVEHKGTDYFRVKIERVLTSPVYLDANNQVIPNEVVKPWLYASGSSSRQNVENEIIHREYKMENIRNIRINKEEYQLVS